ncbi:MAG: trypsin-like peptidase domain-containing protein [Patescibacteria group bacterium]|nr:trypsin-like peptidase domain-containing protein [Patescibacteria group bacterium]
MLKKIIKKIIKILSIVFVIAVIGGVSGVTMERNIVPWLSSFKCLERFPILQKANERITVINKTEQVTVHENFSVTNTSQNVLPVVVSIVEYADEKDVQKENEIKTSSDIQSHIKTGIILTGDGLIMSVIRNNADVFEEDSPLLELNTSKRYKIFTSSGKEFEAKKIFVDQYAEVEFYKMEAANLPAAQFGNSDELETGEKIIIIGNAAGEYQNTFSLGVINEKNKRFSLLNSELSSSEKMEGAIMCDALINEKNMGGPIVDFNGTVVGIARYITKDGENIGFMIPINRLRFTIERAIQGQRNPHGVLGAYYLSINREIALLNHLMVNKGALIYSFSGQRGLAVKKGSAADIAGLQLGDIVLSVDSKEITLDVPLSQMISKYQADDKIMLTIMRNGEIKSLKVILK